MCSVDSGFFPMRSLGVQHSVLRAMFRSSIFDEYRDAQEPVGPLYCVTAILGQLYACDTGIILTVVIYKLLESPC